MMTTGGDRFSGTLVGDRARPLADVGRTTTTSLPTRTGGRHRAP